MSNKTKLPDGWRWEKLGCIFELKYGTGLSKDYRKEGPVPVFGSNGVVGYHSEAITKGKTIIIGRKGSAGKVVWSNTACWPIDTTYFVDELRIDCDLRFLYYLLKFLNLTELDKSSAVPGLNRDDVYAILIPLPSTIDDQIAIATELERKMTEVEKMRRAALRQKEAIKAMQGAILREVFPYKVGDKLPDGWRWEKIDDLCNVQSGGTPLSSNQEYYGGDIKWAITEDLTRVKIYIDDTLTKITPLGLENSTARLFPEDTVLFAMYGSIGRCAITKVPMATNQAILGLMPKDKRELNSQYLYFCLFHGKNNLIKQGRTGTQKNINAEIVKNFEILLPSTIDDQIAIATELERKMAEIDKLRHAADNQLEAVEALPGAILREVFDFEEKIYGLK